MRVKRYVVNALPEAVSLIRSELGKDAVILETKEIKVGGFMGFFRKRRVEVIAAVESNAAKTPETPQRMAPPEVSAVVQQILQTAQKPNSTAQEILIPPLPEKMPDKKEKREEKEQFIIDEIRELKAFMVKMSKDQRKLQTLSPPLVALKERLTRQEVEEAVVEKLLNGLQEQQSLEGAEYDAEMVWKKAATKLGEWLEPFSGETISTNVRVVHFVGPTGVGKTTTIAKLAAEQTIKMGKKVGFITSDTYRIAAVDQLRTYANILNVPLEVVFSPMDLPKAHRNLEDRSLILMDTAGRNFRSELHVSEVISLLNSGESGETLLVLSMTGKSTDMSAIAARFSQYGVRKAIFTKLDETEVYGAILNLILEHGLCPTHLASGQNVPDDIATFRVAEYVAMLLGEVQHE